MIIEGFNQKKTSKIRNYRRENKISQKICFPFKSVSPNFLGIWFFATDTVSPSNFYCAKKTYFRGHICVSLLISFVHDKMQLALLKRNTVSCILTLQIALCSVDAKIKRRLRVALSRERVYHSTFISDKILRRKVRKVIKKKSEHMEKIKTRLAQIFLGLFFYLRERISKKRKETDTENKH